MVRGARHKTNTGANIILNGRAIQHDARALMPATAPRALRPLRAVRGANGGLRRVSRLKRGGHLAGASRNHAAPARAP
jgi:hypothetical protein